MKRFVAAACAVMSAIAACAAPADAVFCKLSVKEKPDMSTLLGGSATLSNAKNSYGLSFSNKRAHGKDSRRFKMAVSNGLQNGFSALVDSFALMVNGIAANRLQLKGDKVRKWTGRDGEEGVVLTLNFDGAWVDVRFSMRPGSPVLWGEVAKSASERQMTPITNVAVRVTAIPSFLECGHGKKTRFSKYARQVRTASRLLTLPPNRNEKTRPDDRYFVLQDGEYDGSAEGRGNGPSATWPLAPTQGTVTLNDSWTTNVTYNPDLSRPFRFALLEFKSHRISNEDFLKQTKANCAANR